MTRIRQFKIQNQNILWYSPLPEKNFFFFLGGGQRSTLPFPRLQVLDPLLRRSSAGEG